MLANPVRPPADLVDLYRSDDGPVLDLPLIFNPLGTMRANPHYVFLGAFHQRQIAGCYNSFNTQAQDDLVLLANRLPDSDAVAALAALGFRTLMVHEEFLGSRGGVARLREENWAKGAGTGLPLVHLGHTAEHTAYRLPASDADASLAPLAAGAAATAPVLVRRPKAFIRFVFRNGGTSAYRHPDPIEPTALVVRWIDKTGQVALEHRLRALLPLALASGVSVGRTFSMPIATVPGDYDVVLVPADRPDLVIARTAVTVPPET
jgi:hypothetical protein